MGTGRTLPHLARGVQLTRKEIEASAAKWAAWNEGQKTAAANRMLTVAKRKREKRLAK